MRSHCLLPFAVIASLVILACGGEGEETVDRTATPATPSATSTATRPPPATSLATPTLEATETLPSGSAELVRSGSTERRAVALTFDAGADAGFTSQVLDILKANGITASFGITGRWAEQNPDLLRRIVREGHHLINHSYDHSSFTGLSTGEPPLTQAQRWQQLDRTEEVLRSIAGVEAKPYFRPPYGDYDDSVNSDLSARGYRYNVLWSVDSQGWNGLSADEIVERCLRLAQAGAIYIFHVGSASQDAMALQRIIDGLRAGGYAMGSVPELLGIEP